MRQCFCLAPGSVLVNTSITFPSSVLLVTVASVENAVPNVPAAIAADPYFDQFGGADVAAAAALDQVRFVQIDLGAVNNK